MVFVGCWLLVVVVVVAAFLFSCVAVVITAGLLLGLLCAGVYLCTK